MISSCQQWLFVVLLLLCLVSRMPASEKAHETGILIEAAEFDPCHYDCAPFGRPSLFYCVQVNGSVLIGSRKADWWWSRTSSNLFELQGQTISVRYDNRSLWIVRSGTTEVYLSRDHLLDVFRSPVCTAEIHRQWLTRFGDVQRPTGVPPQAVLVPQGDHSYFWVSCVFVPASNWDACSLWDSGGSRYAVREVVSQPDRRAVLDADLVINPLTTINDYQFHLKNGLVLEDWAKGRINNIPAPDSPRPLPPLASSPPAR
jgi:hypothetical protein